MNVHHVSMHAAKIQGGECGLPNQRITTGHFYSKQLLTSGFLTPKPKPDLNSIHECKSVALHAGCRATLMNDYGDRAPSRAA